MEKIQGDYKKPLETLKHRTVYLINFIEDFHLYNLKARL